MNPKRKKRLILASLIVGGVALAVTFMLMALRQNINLFFSPTQVAAGEGGHEQRPPNRTGAYGRRSPRKCRARRRRS